MPNVNFVSNIGFGSDITHKKDKNNIFAEMKIEEINEIIHPSFVLADQEADLLLLKCVLAIKVFLSERKVKH